MKYLAGAIALTIAVTAVAIFSRPILPIDETRYVSVAWEAYATGDLLVSHKNGETYAHKPPLLFWLINASWAIFGVSEIAARIVAPLAGLLCLPLVRRIAQQLWPTEASVANYSPFILASFSVWLLFAPLTMFDTLLTLSALIAVCGMLQVVASGKFLGWAVMGIGMGLGILTKGPVIFVSTLPLALLAIWWKPPRVRDGDESCGDLAKLNPTSRQLSLKAVGCWSSGWRWYVGLVASVTIAAMIGLSWAIPSALAGGEEYANELLWGQTAGRVTKSFSHRHPFYWYVPILPLCLMPWLFLGTVWRGARLVKLDWGMRLLACWIVAPLCIFSLISGKQVHYLMPIFPACALMIARAISLVQQPVPRGDVMLLASGTCLLGLVPLAFNFVPQLGQLGLANIVPNYFIPLIMLIAIGIYLVCSHSVQRVVL